MSLSLEGKVAIVTGGASGIGLATTKRLTDAGATVLVADLNAQESETAIRCDVSDAGEVDAAVAAAVDRFGGLDILVNNAGIPVLGPLTELSNSDFMRAFAVNVGGVFNGIKAAAPRMAERGGGVIVSTASTAGLGGMPVMGAYASSKAAVINLTQTAALELRPLAIRVNCVLPGLIGTPMLDQIKTAYEALAPVPVDDLIAAKQGRGGEPDDIARAIHYLVSDQAEFISGHALVADNAMSVSLF